MRVTAVHWLARVHTACVTLIDRNGLTVVERNSPLAVGRIGPGRLAHERRLPQGVRTYLRWTRERPSGLASTTRLTGST